jgi:hypothetical protein
MPTSSRDSQQVAKLREELRTTHDRARHELREEALERPEGIGFFSPSDRAMCR